MTTVQIVLHPSYILLDLMQAEARMPQIVIDYPIIIKNYLVPQSWDKFAFVLVDLAIYLLLLVIRKFIKNKNGLFYVIAKYWAL